MNAQTEVRLYNLKRAMRPDLNNEQFERLNVLLKAANDRFGPALHPGYLGELNTLAPFRVVPVHSDAGTAFKILASMADNLTAQLSPTFRREPEAYKVAAWLCCVERTRKDAEKLERDRQERRRQINENMRRFDAPNAVSEVEKEVTWYEDGKLSTMDVSHIKGDIDFECWMDKNATEKNFILCMKIYRTVTGSALKEAKDRVERYWTFRRQKEALQRQKDNDAPTAVDYDNDSGD